MIASILKKLPQEEHVFNAPIDEPSNEHELDMPMMNFQKDMYLMHLLQYMTLCFKQDCGLYAIAYATSMSWC